ncbi:3-dehydroquinate dehydratase [Gorillibacterium sp. sgz5001074]|uniref:3-dehydroquinate dehydratase n=1 Tax=Gorillibacterium sp. sgz5001074 TaxID=3446695 RepID=UPI003F6751B0
MPILIQFQNKVIPVYIKSSKSSKRALDLLVGALEAKWNHGKSTVKQCLTNLISVEIDGCEAMLHSFNERDSLALSLY